MNTYNAFQILELKYYSTEKEVKERYKELVKQYHPDVCDWESTAYFQKINRAYEIALEFASKNKNVHKPRPPANTNVKEPVKTKSSKNTASYTRRSPSANKNDKSLSKMVGWLVIGGVALILLLMLIPGLQIIVLLLILYGVTRVLK